MSMSMLHVHVNAAFHVNASCQCQCPLTYIEMPDCPASGQFGTGLKKLTMPKPVRYRTKLTQSGILLIQYWTKIPDAQMPMPALVSSMPMPSYASGCPIPQSAPTISYSGSCLRQNHFIGWALVLTRTPTTSAENQVPQNTLITSSNGSGSGTEHSTLLH
jgi:hypothetical protein